MMKNDNFIPNSINGNSSVVPGLVIDKIFNFSTRYGHRQLSSAPSAIIWTFLCASTHSELSSPVNFVSYHPPIAIRLYCKSHYGIGKEVYFRNKLDFIVNFRG
jgi:hypothetical protein